MGFVKTPLYQYREKEKNCIYVEADMDTSSRHASVKTNKPDINRILMTHVDKYMSEAVSKVLC